MSKPVAYIDKNGAICSIAESQRELQDGNYMRLRPIYTHPVQPELVKAVEGAIELLVCVWQGEKGVDWQEKELEEKAHDLRAALEMMR